MVIGAFQMRDLGMVEPQTGITFPTITNKREKGRWHRIALDGDREKRTIA